MLYYIVIMAKKFQGVSSVFRRGDKQQDDREYLVGLDIGTEFVKAMIGEVKGDTVEIIGVGRAHQELADMQAGAISDIAAVVQNCDNALAQAEKQAEVSARSAIVGIAGELVKGKTVTVKCRRNKPDTSLAIEEMTQIVQMVQERAADRARRELSVDLGGKEIEIRLVNSALVSIEIDGYPVTNPLGFQGKDVVVQLYTAFAPLIHIGAIEKVAQELDLDLLAVAAEPFAVARSVMGNDPNQNKNAIIMDVGGGTTDIAVIQEGGLQGTEIFSIGGRAFTRAIERELNIEFAEAEKQKLALSESSTASKDNQEIDIVLQRTLDVWTSGVELALDEFSQLDYLPENVLLCGGGASLPPLLKRLKLQDWTQKLPFTKSLSVQHIAPKDVVLINDSTGDADDHTFVTAMGLLRVGLDTLQQQEGLSTGTIRQKIDRMLRI